ncbi:MAG: S8 family serine peptidase [Anaerolineae bacterium]|nr:S8 family serine peptidase [Anaerolineae bacterium]
MNHRALHLLAIVVLVSGLVMMASPLVGVQGASAASALAVSAESAWLAPPAQPRRPPVGASPQIATASEANFYKFDTDLQEKARAGGDELVDVRVIVADQGVHWPEWVQAVPRAVSDEATGLPVWYGRVKAAHLAKLAGLDFVVQASLIERLGPVPRFRDPDLPVPQVTDAMRERLRTLRDRPPVSAAGVQGIAGWWDVGPGHESKKAWNKGYTGDGVRVANIDSGVDFCHPDLYGTWATFDVAAARNYSYGGVPNYLDYFDGWPIALSPFSNYALFFDLWYNGAPTPLNAFAYGFSKFADTRASGVGNTIWFDGKPYITTGTASIFNPVYHIGYHPDTSLEKQWWHERIGVLVVDEDGDGVYETVYVDLNNNRNFRDDKPANKADPTACWDADGDGYYDLSGGLVYFISDGKHWPQMMDWWWDPAGFGMTPPGPGELVAFMFDDPWGPAAAHGTLTASNIVGQGRIDGDPSVFGGDTRPSWKPAGVGGMVQGGGKGAKLIAIGDIYINYTASTEEAWYFASFGVDGFGDTDDGAHITSNSYGESETDNDEWDNRSRLITRLNTRSSWRGFPNTYGQRVAHLFSTGNGAPGYGTNAPPSGSTIIAVGASTQFGSVGWDSISGPDQVVWGDVIPWSNRGPTAVGHLAPHVTADGAFAAGAIASNGWGDGWSAWMAWGGTSRSTPVAAGNLALIYDAWKQRTGQWPTWRQARELLMNGATDQKYDVLVQGAGAVNADKSTDIAGGLYGLHISPEAWYPGDYRGAEFPAFAQIIAPGSSDSQVFTAMNHSPFPITAGLSATYLAKISSYEFNVTAAIAHESPYSFNRPDYLFDVTQYAPGGIPSDTALMVAEIIHPFEEFEPQGDNNVFNNNLWRILWYSWKDVNGDGNLWTDANGNGAVNVGEIDHGEYTRFADGYGAHTYRQVSVKDPRARWKDGIYLGLQHRLRQASVPVSHLRIRVTFYRKAPWTWIAFNVPSVTVSPNSAATFMATVAIPSGTPYGLYEGAIEVSIPTHGPHSGYTTIIPVVINVAFSGDLTAAPITLGGQPRADTRYDNSYVTGPQDWTWRAESGDWRFYFLDQTSTPAAGTRLVVRDEWGDAAPETDLDTLILGPTSGPYQRAQPPFLFSFGDFSTLDPLTFGPYRLEMVASSVNAYLGSGIWNFQTATGGNVEYVVTPLASGLYEVLQHTVRYEGDQFEVPFTKTLSTLVGPTALAYTNYFSDTISFSSNITHEGGLVVEAYGLRDTRTDLTGSIEQDPTNDNYCDWRAGGIYTYTTTLASNVARFTAHVTVGSNDLDLYLLYDADRDGFDCPDDQIAFSINPVGTDDEVTVHFPAGGDYMVVIQGWSVSPSPSPFSWYWIRTDLDNSLVISNEDLAIGPYKDATFDLSNVPGACDDVRADCNDGVLYVGFADAPRLFSIPVTVEYVAADLSSSTKVVSANTALPGDPLTYTIHLVNSSSIHTAAGAVLTDTLPAEVAFGSIVSGGASYDAGLNAVRWSGDIPPASTHTIVYMVTVNADLPDGTFITNTAEVNNGLGHVITIGPARTEIESVDLSASTKEVDQVAAVPGATLLYTITLRNTGPVAATKAVLHDVLPEHTSFVDGSATGGAIYDHGSNAIRWSGSIGASGEHTVKYRVRVAGGLSTGTLITNTAEVGDGLGTTWRTNVVTTRINAADLSRSEKVASSRVVRSGEVVTFTVTIRNTGVVSTEATMVDALPAGLTLVGVPQVISGRGSVISAGNVITWTGTLDAEYNNQAMVRFAAQVGPLSLCQTITNIARLGDGQGGIYEVSATIGGPCWKMYLLPIFRR